MSTVPNKVIYSMIGVSKYYDKKAVLKDIYLSYFYGAKIGVIGLNGSGKSSLLRILAGLDQDFQGKTAVSPGFTIGFLEQEPQLDPSRTIREVVGQGVQPIVCLLRGFAGSAGQSPGKARQLPGLGPGRAAGNGDGRLTLSSSGDADQDFVGR